MFFKLMDENFHQILDGISVKTLAVGEKMLFSEFRLEKGNRLPMHKHPQEQAGRLLQGKLMLTIGSETSEMTPGDCWAIPGDVEHGAEILENSIAIEVFSPVREDYLKYL